MYRNHLQLGGAVTVVVVTVVELYEWKVKYDHFQFQCHFTWVTWLHLSSSDSMESELSRRRRCRRRLWFLAIPFHFHLDKFVLAGILLICTGCWFFRFWVFIFFCRRCNKSLSVLPVHTCDRLSLSLSVCISSVDLMTSRDANFNTCSIFGNIWGCFKDGCHSGKPHYISTRWIEC